ncbi:MAG: hypothetical protein EH225_02155 [Calditrichaeota bacterium]|nr:hypothetical protein [Calditrichota bacterium]RQW07276.1 MAG: hypothetical protein EH225_02155 [Calditrichota bacterium]
MISELKKVFLQKSPQLLVSIFLLFVAFPIQSPAQSTGEWGMSIFGNYSRPIGGLADWFKPAPDAGISVGQKYNENWFIEGLIEYTKFDRENLEGYPKDKLELSLEHIGLLVSGRYSLGQISIIKPYINLAAGVFYWKGIRGEVQADTTVQPAVPHIDQKTLEEANWGFRSGIGFEIPVSSAIAMDILACYRFVLGDLYPTLQPNIELEGVSGFQTVNLSVALRYYF